jgi:hypothetical protein
MRRSTSSNLGEGLSAMVQTPINLTPETQALKTAIADTTIIWATLENSLATFCVSSGAS